MSEDFPTFERPITANSGKLARGQSATLVLLFKNTDFLMRGFTGCGRSRLKYLNPSCKLVGGSAWHGLARLLRCAVPVTGWPGRLCCTGRAKEVTLDLKTGKLQSGMPADELACRFEVTRVNIVTATST